MKLNNIQKIFASIFMTFTKKFYDEGEKKAESMISIQKEDKQSLLAEISKIMLNYTVVDAAMKLTNNQFKNEKNRFDKMIAGTFTKEYNDEKVQITNILTNTAKDKYDSTNFLYGVDKRKSKKLSTNEIKELLNKKIEGKNFSDRIWDSKNDVAKELQNEIKKFLQGKTNLNDIEAVINSKFDVNEYATKRLVRDQISRVQSSINEKWLKDVGIKKVMFDATLDSKTTERCRNLDSKTYDVDDPNRPIPPLHIQCRSTLIPITDKGYQPIGDVGWKDFKDWQSNMDKKSWHDTTFTKNEYKDKKDITNYLMDKYNLKVSDSRKNPIDVGIYGDFTNWLDRFEENFKGFTNINPVKLENLNIKADLKNTVGYYSYYQNTPKVEELALNGKYFTNKAFNEEYIKHCIESKWTVSNAEGYKTFVHEYGHHVANSLKWMEDYSGTSNDWCKEFVNDVIKEYNKRYNRDISFKDISEVVSRYGGTSHSEAFAETFAEYFGGENPREFAQVFGEMCEDRINKQIG